MAERLVIDDTQAHADLTAERIVAAVERRRASLEDPGFCIHCGGEAYNVEPDARQCFCDACGENGIYGAEELLFHIAT